MQFKLRNSTQNPFHDGESFARWHLNGILAENEGNVDGGRTQNLIAELYYFDAIQNQNFHSKSILGWCEICQNGI